MIKEYTLKEIKKAFQDIFYEIGEIYFENTRTNSENEQSSIEEWDCFRED